jgi:hypothetical protein
MRVLVRELMRLARQLAGVADSAPFGADSIRKLLDVFRELQFAIAEQTR